MKWTESEPRKKADVVSKRSSLPKEATDSKKSPVGITELDEILEGGFPARSLILLSGNAGSGKTILSTQFLFNGAVKFGEKGVYVSFAENREDFYKNMLSLGMDMRSLETKGLFKFIDMVTMRGDDALKIVTEKIVKTTSELKAKRLIIDSLNGLLQTVDAVKARMFLHTVLGRVTKSLGVTTLIIGEVPHGEDKTGLGVEEFIADGVIYMTHTTGPRSESRKITIDKMRGTRLDRSSFEYLIAKKYGGIGPIMLPRRAKTQPSSTERLSTGIKELDRLLHGGVFRGSVTLIEGASGIGKTIACLEFAAASALKGEKALFLSFEESIGQIERTMTEIGLNPHKLGDNFVIESYVPEAFTPLHYYMLLKDMLELHAPTIIVFDTITAMEHLSSREDFIAFSRYLQLLCKENELTVFLTSTHGTTEAVTSSEVSTMADNIIIFRYYEVKDRMGREMLILKTRGSAHDKKAMPFEITGSGINIQA